MVAKLFCRWTLALAAAFGAAGQQAGQTGLGGVRLAAREVSPADVEACVAPQLRHAPEALAASKFLLGHIWRNFDAVASVVNEYALHRRQLLNELPQAFAEKRYQEKIQQHRQAFLKGEGPFVLDGRPIQRILTPEVKIQVFDLKTDERKRFSNAFAWIDYLNRTTAPESWRGRVKRTCLVIPVKDGWMLAEPAEIVGGSPMVLNFVARFGWIRELVDMSEHW